MPTLLACAVLNCFAGSGYWPYTDDEDVRHTGENMQGHTTLNAHVDPKNHYTELKPIFSQWNTLTTSWHTSAAVRTHTLTTQNTLHLWLCLGFRPLIACSSSVAVLLYLCSRFLHSCLDDARCQGKLWRTCFCYDSVSFFSAFAYMCDNVCLFLGVPWCAPVKVKHGHVSCQTPRGERYKNVLGTRCKIRCKTGYEMHGSSEILCMASKQWSGNYACRGQHLLN